MNNAGTQDERTDSLRDTQEQEVAPVPGAEGDPRSSAEEETASRPEDVGEDRDPGAEPAAICSLCARLIGQGEDSAILTMGGYAHPRYLCPDCAARLDVMGGAEDPVAIREAMDRVASDLEKRGTDDRAAMETVVGLLSHASERLAAIEAGTYDFAEDGETPEEEIPEDVPEELRESEEDIAQEEEESARVRRTDSILNILLAVAMAAAVIALLIKLIWFR